MMAINTTEPDELVRGIKAIARYCQVTPKTIWAWRKEGKELPITGTGKNQYAMKNELLTAIKKGL